MSAFDHPKFVDTYPVSFLMREAHPECWFRIHSLPEGKRYPESDAEWETLLARHREGEVDRDDVQECRVGLTELDDDGVIVVPPQAEPPTNVELHVQSLGQYAGPAGHLMP